jgi:Zn ribbon nucleic-acid-binding protein
MGIIEKCPKCGAKAELNRFQASVENTVEILEGFSCKRCGHPIMPLRRIESAPAKRSLLPEAALAVRSGRTHP